jgi:predicted nucleotidyltransferase
MESYPEIEQTLESLVAQLREAAGGNLLGVALYGGLAKGRFTPGVSDVNLLVVVAKADFGSLLPLAPVLTAALRESRVVSFLVTPEDLRVSAQLFPGRVFDIQMSHRLLWGKLYLSGFPVSMEDLLLRARQEVKNAELRLRLRAVERGGEPEALWRGMTASLPKVAVNLETVMRSRGLAVPADRPGILRQAGRELGLPAERTEPFALLRRVDERPVDADVLRLYAAYLEWLAAVSDRLEQAAG